MTRITRLLRSRTVTIALMSFAAIVLTVRDHDYGAGFFTACVLAGIMHEVISAWEKSTRKKIRENAQREDNL